ncbi:MAG: HAD family hydrolase, partial [Clostridia bacterium]|nr:HAD family hydrolase [Clostridia bacterium]
VFDLDHTLFDRYATLRRISPFMCERLKEDLAPGVGEEEFWRELSAADRRFIVEGWEAIFRFLVGRGVFRENAAYPHFRDNLAEAVTREAAPFPFEDEFFAALRARGLKVALITNGSERIQGAKLRLLGMAPRFDALLIADGVVTPLKPDPAPFLLMAERLGEDPGSLLYVGDNPVNDVDGSRRAGYIPVWVRTTGVWCEGIARAPYEIDSVRELPPLIDKLRNEQ